MAKISYIYCDSCVFLAYFNAEVGRVDVLESLFAQVKREKTKKLITSVLTISEVTHTAREKKTQTLQIGIENKLDAFWADDDLGRYARWVSYPILIPNPSI